MSGTRPENFPRILQKSYDEILHEITMLLLGFSQKRHKILQYKSVGLDRIDENKTAMDSLVAVKSKFTAMDSKLKIETFI